MVWKTDGPQGNEAAKIMPLAVQYLRGIGLDIGCGRDRVLPQCIPIDNSPHVSLPAGHRDGLDLAAFGDGALDYVFSSHFLEHVEDTKAALREWWRVIKPGGHLVLYLPHKELYPNIGVEGGNPDHKHDFEPKDIRATMGPVAKESGQYWDLVEDEERDGGNEYSFFIVFRKQLSGET